MSLAQQIDTPWYSALTVDLVYKVLQNSLFNWFVTWIIPLSLLSIGHAPRSPPVLASSIWAAFVGLGTIFYAIDERVAFGTSKYRVLKEEVAVVTGGANGLGLATVQQLAMHGVKVAVLDVEGETEENEMPGVTFYTCDVADPKQVETVAKEIRKNLGNPTVLINNAGIMSPKPVFEMTDAEVERAFRVNTLSHFTTIRTFLPGMLKEGRGSIVTVASVLGHLGCANLAAYSSTKAALHAMHASLRADLRDLAATNPAAANVKTVLVAPGQLNTRMFGSVRTPSTIAAPVVEPIHLAREIIRYIDDGRSGEIETPLYAKYVGWLRVVPPGVRELARWASGMDRAMQDAMRRKDGSQKLTKAKA